MTLRLSATTSHETVLGCQLHDWKGRHETSLLALTDLSVVRYVAGERDYDDEDKREIVQRLLQLAAGR